MVTKRGGYVFTVAGYWNMWKHSYSLYVNGFFLSHTVAVKPTDKAKSSLVELFSVKESSTLLVPTSFKKSITPITYTDTTG